MGSTRSKTKHSPRLRVKMIFHAPHILLSLRWIVPAIGIFGSATNHCTVIALLRLLTLPLPSKLAWRLHRRLTTHYMSLIGFFYENWSGVEFYFYGEQYPLEPENVLYISNHQCTVDWVIADNLCTKQSGYGGRVRYMLKNAIKYIPIYGWQLGDRGGIYLKRDRSQNTDSIKKKLLWFQENEVPVWLVIFPEGTRYNPNNQKKLENSWAYLESKGMDRLTHVLAPHTRGFELSVDALKQYFDAVYDVTIIYEGTERQGIRASAPDLFSFYSGKCRKVHIDFRRISMKDIPSDPEGQRTFMYNIFKRKDKQVNRNGDRSMVVRKVVVIWNRMIGEFLSSGVVPSPSQSLPLPLSYTLPPTLLYLALLLVVMGTAQGRKWNLRMTVFFSVIGYMLINRM